jgi:putative tryptophan/tyrosine transport system substrate-binding protein
MHFEQLKRREFIALLGGAAAWPLAGRAQQGERVRRIGVIMNFAADDPEAQARIGAFAQGLAQLGWSLGRNVRIDYRWGTDSDRIRRNVAELLALAPDVIIGNSTVVMGPLQEAARTVPIVFINVVDPVGAGFVSSLARPGGNATGFTAFEYSISGKWLELLKEIAPRITRAAVIRDPARGPGIAQFAAVQGAAPALAVEVSPIDARDPSEMERGLAAFVRSPNGGLIVTPGGTGFQRDLIIAMAARHRLPAVYPYRYYVASGGLASYGPDPMDQYRRAAGYIDRILKGEKPGDLPVQAPVKYETAVNLKIAKALGLEIPATVLARADEVIE